MSQLETLAVVGKVASEAVVRTAAAQVCNIRYKRIRSQEVLRPC